MNVISIRSLYSLVLLLFSYFTVNAQGSIYSNQSIVVDSGATLYVEGDIQLETDSSSFTNKGSIILKNDWINNSDSIALINGGKGVVQFNGDDQKIRGTNVTQFYHLQLNEPNTVKEAEIKVIIDSLLELNGVIFETNSYQIHVLNSNPNAIQWNSNGYISTETLGGQLLRNTTSTSPYLFPLGNSSLQHNYRVIEIIPSSPDSNTYGAALLAESINNINGVSVSGANAPYFEDEKESRIQNLNTTYFHSIYQYNSSDSATVKLYYFTDDSENLFTSIAQWKHPENKWIDQKFNITSPTTNLSNYGSPNRIASKTATSNFESDIFTFIENNLFIPNGFTPNNDGINDSFVIENIEQYEDNELIILNRWGNEIYKASPYDNTWNGIANSGDLFLQGQTITDGTYFYILKLNEELPILKGFIEVKAN